MTFNPCNVHVCLNKYIPVNSTLRKQTASVHFLVTNIKYKHYCINTGIRA